MAQQMKVLSKKPDSLSSIPGTHVTGGEKQLHVLYTHTHIHIKKYLKIKTESILNCRDLSTTTI